MLSLRTSTSAKNAVNALNRTTTASSVSATRLGTGYRINSAADDAAGLQIATRLKAQSSGTTVAMRNIQNAMSLMQVADSTVSDMIHVITRMNGLAIQAADASMTEQDKTALQDEFVELYHQHWTLLGTKYNNEDLLVITSPNYRAKLFEPMDFQVGASGSDVMKVDLGPLLLDTLGTIGYSTPDLTDILTRNASSTIEDTATAIKQWSAVQSAIGATMNVLGHQYNNLETLDLNTRASVGRIMDTDYATEVASKTSNDMLIQAGTAMLKQNSSVSSMILSLVQ